LTERLILRGGYLFNTNPISDTATLFNVQAPSITQHTLSLGSSLEVTEDIIFTMALVHGFRNTVSGPIGEIPGASASFDVQTDSLIAGLNIKFGPGKKTGDPAADIPTSSSTP
jgi:long-chain fatty acid transport protein